MKTSTSKDPDIFLIHRIKDGDTSAFRLLVEKYKDVSLSLASSILKDSILAEDVLQDVFIKVYEQLDSFKFNSNFSTWLYRIVVNMSFNALKKLKNIKSIDEIEVGEILDTTIIGIESIKETDQKKYIVLAFERLRPDEALVLRLFYLCELSIYEIEEITDFNPSKIKVDLHRGRGNMHFHLKQILKEEMNHLL